METIKARVVHVRFHSEETGFTIVSMRNTDKGAFVLRCNSATDINEGVNLTAEGEWIVDKTYGEQFVADKIEQELPTTNRGIMRYLTSGYIEGVGMASAKKLVERFGTQLWYILNNDPKRLYIPGIRKWQIDKLIESWKLQKENNEAMVFLQKFEVGAGTAMKIIRKYGKETIQTVKNNPYILADEVDGIGFKRADTIALNMGYAKDGEHRIRAGILFDLRDKSAAKGDMFQYEEKLVKDVAKLLDVAAEKVYAQIVPLLNDEKVIDNEKAIYIPQLFYAECSAAKDLVRLCKAKGKAISVPDDLGKDKGITYDDIQMDAIKVAMRSKVMVLTGGPGTGKTTTTNGIIAAWEKAGLDILLAAPTGRAAKRMTEATGKPSKTIHRLLSFNPEDGGFEFRRNNQFKGDALIVDEASMVDTELMAALLEAIPDRMRLVLVGDVDQLPSVGPGNVLRDIIESGVIPVVRLTRIFRQAQTSKIITNAHRINQGIMPEIANNRQSDFFFLDVENPAQVEHTIVDLVTNRLPHGYNLDPSAIQVLAPMRKSNNGVNQLNQDLQNILNPIGAEMVFGKTVFRQGDRVMQIRNDYNKGVFNGDMGYVVGINEDTNTLLVNFTGNDKEPVEYKKKELGDLQLSYATTIHKSQGSEYPVVVIPLTTQFAIMLQRNLIYTAVTRAKKVCVIVGQKKALSMAVRNKSIQKRNTLLKERLISENKK